MKIDCDTSGETAERIAGLRKRHNRKSNGNGDAVGVGNTMEIGAALNELKFCLEAHSFIMLRQELEGRPILFV